MADVEGLRPDIRLGLARTSRFRGTLYYPELEASYGRWPFNKDTFAPRESDVYYTVQPAEAYRLELLAHKLYGSAFFWWVLALVNDIRNPFVAPKGGDILRVPDVSQVFTVLQAL